jgi:hypothetical protein
VTLISIGQLDFLIQQQQSSQQPAFESDSSSSSSASSTPASTPSDDPPTLSSSPSLTLTEKQRRELSALSESLPEQDKERLKRASHILRQRLILRLWLDDHGLLEYAQKLA